MSASAGRPARGRAASLALLLALVVVVGATLQFILVLKTPTTTASVRPPSKAALAAPKDSDDPRELYLELLKRALTRYQFAETYQRLPDDSGARGRFERFSYRATKGVLGTLLRSANLEIVRVAPFDPVVRENGQDWPLEGETMVGLKRLDNLQACITDVLKQNVPGDLIEAGAWRGGACIFMRGVLKAYGDKTRRVWVADSFEGLPKPDRAQYPEFYWQGGEMAVSLEDVKDNFRVYGMLDGQVQFLKGFFKDTLPTAPIEKLALLRLDGDLYESTLQPLEALYDKVSPGGYIVEDDWNLTSAKKAVEDFRAKRGITDPIVRIDNNGVYWRKSR